MQLPEIIPIINWEKKKFNLILNSLQGCSCNIYCCNAVKACFFGDRKKKTYYLENAQNHESHLLVRVPKKKN